MPRLAAVLALPLLLVFAGGCMHDLDALRSEANKGPGLRDGGKSTMVATLSDAGGSGDAGGRDGGTPSAGACEPCDVPDAGAALGLRACCRGAGNTECGLTFGGGAVCLARNSLGTTDQGCPGFRTGSGMVDGCCRPDSRCGLNVPMFGLGCVPREEILLQLGATKADAVACTYACLSDADCGGDTSGLKCVADPKDPTHMQRSCVRECERDADCAKPRICGLGNDIPNDRVVAYCQTPATGAADVGAYCSAAGDCATGVCVQLVATISDCQGDPSRCFCSALCKNTNDCATGKVCGASMIQSPAKDKTQTFHICNQPAKPASH